MAPFWLLCVRHILAIPQCAYNAVVLPLRAARSEERVAASPDASRFLARRDEIAQRLAELIRCRTVSYDRGSPEEA